MPTKFVLPRLDRGSHSRISNFALTSDFMDPVVKPRDDWSLDCHRIMEQRGKYSGF
ncbi:palindromic element RPE4 domain-containing protein [bacterium]|nr:palindromic element RPE4 domain-containing protein [bacterium]